MRSSPAHTHLPKPHAHRPDSPLPPAPPPPPLLPPPPSAPNPPGAGRGGAARDVHDRLEEQRRAAEEAGDDELAAELEQGLEATHYAKVTRPGKVRRGAETLKPQHTVATVRVMCTSCEAHTEVPAQKVNRAAGKSTVGITFAKHSHKHACKNGASTLQTQLALDGLPAGGGWKPCCSGRLKVARST